MRRSAAVLLLLLLLFAGAGCSGDDAPVVVLDGSARVPDAEGVVQQVDARRITLDGRRYQLSPELQAFSTYTLEAIPVRNRRGQYVQVGLDGDTVEWLAAYGVVVRAADGPATVYYTGVFVRAAGGRAVFRDGSTVELDRGVDVPARGVRVRVDIDPVRHRARSMTPV